MNCLTRFLAGSHVNFERTLLLFSLVEQYFLPLEQEVSCHHVLSCRRRELVLEGDVFVSCQNRLQQGFFLQIGDEIAGHRICLLGLIVPVGIGNNSVSEAIVSAPELARDAPGVFCVERNVHAEYHRQSSLDFRLEVIHLILGHIAINIVQRDEVHPIHHL